MENPVLNVAFIVALTAFFKEQFGLTGWKVLIAAFGVALVIAFLPLVSALVPAAAPWLDQLLQVILLVLAAAGSVDFIKQIKK
jgi:hypothetical protein